MTRHTQTNAVKYGPTVLHDALARRMAAHICLMADLAKTIGIDPKDKTTWPQTWLDEITVINAARRVVNAQELADSHYQADLNNDLRRALGNGKLAPWERDIERLLNIVDAVLGITDPE